MTNESQGRPTKNERRQQAREQAKLAREANRRKEKRNRFLLQGSVVLGVVAVIAVVGIVIAQSVKPAGPGPKNMASGGIVFGQDLKVQETKALPAGADLIPTKVDRGNGPLDIVVYSDYLCPYCGLFEQTNATVLETWVGSGEATLEIYPMNSLDALSLGTKYSTRAANAVACAANYAPDAAWGVHTALLSAEVQPAESTAGLKDSELIALLKKNGAKVTPQLKSCVVDRDFGKFIEQNKVLAQAAPPANLAEGVDLPYIKGTPTVLVNGVIAPTDNTFEDFLLKMLSDSTGASSGSAKGESTPTPTP